MRTISMNSSIMMFKTPSTFERQLHLDRTKLIFRKQWACFRYMILIRRTPWQAISSALLCAHMARRRAVMTWQTRFVKLPIAARTTSLILVTSCSCWSCCTCANSTTGCSLRRHRSAPTPASTNRALENLATVRRRYRRRAPTKLLSSRSVGDHDHYLPEAAALVLVVVVVVVVQALVVCRRFAKILSKRQRQSMPSSKPQRHRPRQLFRLLPRVPLHGRKCWKPPAPMAMRTSP
mmetsp:Transcript_37018/g.90709  ORF Transcript_37018/g.90709 Transcript_37018/m.90709 type:complete len:235 (+) Transcript_37018:1720-2424(+)